MNRYLNVFKVQPPYACNRSTGLTAKPSTLTYQVRYIVIFYSSVHYLTLSFNLKANSANSISPVTPTISMTGDDNLNLELNKDEGPLSHMLTVSDNTRAQGDMQVNHLSNNSLIC